MLILRKAVILGLVLVTGLIGTSVAVAAGGSYFASDPPEIPGAAYSAVATTRSTTDFSDGNRIVRSEIGCDRYGRQRAIDAPAQNQ
jgi:hypothetical protein